jgi:hypothetical protein
MPFFCLQRRPGGAQEKDVDPRLLQIQRDRESSARAHHASRCRCDQRPPRPPRRDTGPGAEEECPRRQITTAAGHATTSRRWRCARSRSPPRPCSSVARCRLPPLLRGRAAPSALHPHRIEVGADAAVAVLRDRPHHLAVTRTRAGDRPEPASSCAGLEEGREGWEARPRREGMEPRREQGPAPWTARGRHRCTDPLSLQPPASCCHRTSSPAMADGGPALARI